MRPPPPPRPPSTAGTPAPPDDGSTTISCPVPRTRSSARWPCGACPAIIAGDSSAETAGGWVKHPGNPVLGGQYGTCFDVAVLRENEAYRMWVWWRPKRSVALVQSKDGLSWDCAGDRLAAHGNRLGR